MPLRSVRIVGPGRAGQSFAGALRRVGVDVEVWDRRRDVSDVASGADLVLVCVPDDRIAEVAAAIEPVGAETRTTIAHCSGSRGLDVLSPHRVRASIHPLMSLPDPEVGAERLGDGCAFAVAGAPVATELVDALGGQAFTIDDDQRARYHAAASIAANHLVGLCDQVERLARELGAPPAAFWRLMETTLDNVTIASAAGSTAASVLTGPASRGDWETVAAHLGALPDDERELYRVLAARVATLAGRNWPDALDG